MRVDLARALTAPNDGTALRADLARALTAPTGRLRLLLWLRRLLLPFLALLAGSGPAAAQEAVIFLVRHAETTPDGTRDPGLSEVGAARAKALATLLEDAAIDAVYTTDYRRTRGTAGAVGDAVGAEVRVYDPTHLPELARTLGDDSERVLVVGHSNTTPELVRLLGGDPGPPIPESEYDRLYVLFRGPDGVRTVVLRYGR